MITCTFAGHREVFQPDIPQKLDEAILQIIDDYDSCCFLIGGMGTFDGMCAAAVRAAKRKCKNKKIRLELVLPYFKNELNTEKEYYEKSFDAVVIPSELTGVHYKAAITKRNRWMIDQSDYLIAFVYRDFGGAYAALQYAKKKNKRVINLAN